jgi:uncharacterized DUF497 family protein
MYEWDEAKSATTLKDRGFGFEIMESFLWDYALCVDIQHHDGEERELWLGPIDDHLFAVVVTMREDITRVISLRRAEQHEIRLWRGETGQ